MADLKEIRFIEENETGLTKENVTGRASGDDDISCTFSQKELIDKILKMAKEHPELAVNLYKNNDGSITCKLPLKWWARWGEK